MASEVDICNLALGHLGDEATVTSISPPEGSAQAEHCQRFYPIARDTAIEAHEWNFATRRAVLAQLEMPWSSWRYCYALPTDFIKAIAVLPPDAPSDYTETLPQEPGYSYGGRMPLGSVEIPRDFVIETDENNQRLLYTDQENAVLRYTRRVTDTTRYSPMFVDALSRLLASYLAGPVVKGTEGVNVAQAQLQAYTRLVAAATLSDSNQRRVERHVRSMPAWLRG
ncbi:hypothetical protein [Bordetella genomosp. 1]|uniref:Phage tail protein n=1 Tax=Bordetella genomosp. 1 TaxID=1395607 RepID=A0ABX4EW56_9BORD|nr:hypothetical protein [Bordetella genomosp. 1]OZI58710.1 hypothetical protein CAL27_18685 [Bordetella genomosp. 1]